jgi:iron complex outermembrane recepter protein
VSKSHIQSMSAYFNDELKIGNHLHIDFGGRYEHAVLSGGVGIPYATNPATPAGTPGVIPDIGQSFSGAFQIYRGSFDHVAYTAGVNYELTSNFALYARFAKGFQSGSVDTGGEHPPAELTLYEAGVRYQSPWLSGSLVGFRTEFRDQSYTFTDPSNPAFTQSALADDDINGVQLDAEVKPVNFFNVTVSGVYQEPKLTNLRFNGVAQPQYDGNVPERTPKWLLSVTPAFELPGGLGEIYGRYKYIGQIFADSGDGIALPAYGVFTVGASINVTQRINLNVSVDNLTNVDGYTEGNPRQGQTQTVTNGYFYGRSIVGRNALASVTFKF